jgi:O-antigen/teichoic acid export membrane protein
MHFAAAPRNLTRTVLHGVGLAGAGYLLSQTFTLASYLALARLTTPREFGKFAAGSIIIGVGTLFAESGMLAALIHRRDRLAEAANTALVATVLAGFGMGLVALALSPVIGFFFHSREIALVAAAMSGYLVLRQTTVVPDALMQRRFSFIRRGIVEPAAVVAFGVTAVVACAEGSGVWGLVLGTYASVAMQVLLSWSLVGWRPNLRLVSLRMWHELVQFGRHVVAGEFVRRSTAEISTALVGRFLGAAALGQYYYASRVAARPLAALVDSTSYVLFPAFARISHDESRFARGFLRALRWMCVVAFPASFILLALGEPLFVLLFGERWQTAGYALMAMFAYTAGHSLDSLGSEVFKASGQPRFLLRMHLVAAVLTAAFMVFLLPFGVIGVSAAISFRSVGVAVYAVRTSARVIGLPSRSLVREIWPPAFAGAVMAGVLLPLEWLVVDADSRGLVLGMALLVAEAVLGVIIYLATLTLVSPEIARDLGKIVQVMRKGRWRSPEPSEAEADVPMTSESL